MAKIRYASSVFNEVFDIDSSTEKIDNWCYGWFYFRQSPRGNVKFGITHLLWERLRMQQQGTDEEIQFDHVWLVKSRFKAQIDHVEKQLKNHYKNWCLHNDTKRAGHTEWYTEVPIDEFSFLIDKFVKELPWCEIIKVPLKKPYTATNSSQCPLGLPTNDRYKGKEYIQKWTHHYWKTLA